MEKQLRSFVDRNDILSSVQSRFRSPHSCTTAMLNMTNDIITPVDRGMVTFLVQLDYSKAFDSVSHRVLIEMLKFFGVSKSATKLISGFWVGRCQQVVVVPNTSNILHVSAGVPQGSILGPLLYTICKSLVLSHFSHKLLLLLLYT